MDQRAKVAVVVAVVVVAVGVDDDADNTVVCGLTISATASPTIRITSNHGNFFSALFMTTSLCFTDLSSDAAESRRA